MFAWALGKQGFNLVEGCSSLETEISHQTMAQKYVLCVMILCDKGNNVTLKSTFQLFFTL